VRVKRKNYRNKPNHSHKRESFFRLEQDCLFSLKPLDSSERHKLEGIFSSTFSK